MRPAPALGCVLLAVVALACQPLAKPTPEPTPTLEPAVALPPAAPPATAGQPVVSAPADPRTAWQSSKHARSFVADSQGKNNDCARCHAPMNWMPTDIGDIPATCQSCKFNLPAPKPVAQADWKNIDCEQCHVTAKGVVTPQVAWLDATIAQFDTNANPYEKVTSNTALCEKCHRDAFKIAFGPVVHANMDCTGCHNPHSTAASCTMAACHPNVAKPATPIAGHDAAHAAVACVACHDASGLSAGPTPDKKAWVVFRVSPVPGTSATVPYASHALQRKVDCARCHSEGNSWGLKKY